MSTSISEELPGYITTRGSKNNQAVCHSDYPPRIPIKSTKSNPPTPLLDRAAYLQLLETQGLKPREIQKALKTATREQIAAALTNL